MSKTIFGDLGYKEIVGGDGATIGYFFAVKAVNGADAVVATITNKQGDSSSAITIVSGDILYVTASSITVTSGTIHAYYVNQ